MKFILSSIVLFLCSASFGFAQSSSKPDDNSRHEAERLWELAIEAKGGREKLYSIRNMVVSSDGKFYQGLKKINIHIEDFYVFPNKWWSWRDQRPSIFGLNMSMHNWESRKAYTVQFESAPFRGLEEIDTNDENTNFAGITPDLLLETKWNKPLPEKIFSGK